MKYPFKISNFGSSVLKDEPELSLKESNPMMPFFRMNKTVRRLLFTILVIIIVEAMSWIFRNAGETGREFIFYLRCLALIFIFSFWGFSSHKEWVKNATLSFVSVSVVLFVIDFVFFIILISKIPKSDGVWLFPAMVYNQPDKTLGYIPYPDTTMHSSLSFAGSPVFDIHFTTDKFSHRINPFDTCKNKSRYAIFFGCSVAFGQNLDDSETIPARFAQFLPEYHSYNFAYGGYGTQEMLANLQKPDVRNEIKEKTGAAFYIFINPHINRAIGDMQTYDAWGSDMPYYYEKDDTLIRDGSFRNGRWLISHIYTLLGRSSFLKYFKVNLPFKITEKHYEFVTKMIKESYNQYVSKFGNTNFYVVIFPGEQLDIVPYLKKEHIKFFDYSKLFDRWSPENCYLPYDNHPRARADKIFARQLSSDINKIAL